MYVHKPHLLVSLLLVSIMVTSISSTFPLHNDDYLEPLVNCVTGVVYPYMMGNNIAIITDQISRFQKNFLWYLQHDLQAPTHLINLSNEIRIDKYESMHVNEKWRTVVMLIKNEENYRNHINKVRPLIVSNSKAKFFIIITNKIFTIEEVRMVFQYVWKQRLLNVIIIAMIGQESGVRHSVQVVGFNPFVMDKNGDNGSIYHIIVQTDCTPVNRNENLFPDKMKNLHRYPIQVRGYEKFPDLMFSCPPKGTSGPDPVCSLQGGIDANTLLLLANYINFTLLFKPVTRELIPKNETQWAQFLDVIYRGESEIFANTLPLYLRDTLAMDYTTPLDIFPLNFAVPTAQRIPFMQCLLLAFESDVWILIMFSVVLTGLLMQFLTFVVDKREVVLKRHNRFLYIFSNFLQISIDQPRTLSVRIMFITFTYFSLVVTSIYQGHLARVLGFPMYYPQMDSLEDVAKSNLPIRSFPDHEHVIHESTNEAMHNMLGRYEADKDIFGILDRIGHERDITFYEPAVYLKLIIMDRNLTGLIHIVEQPCIVQYLSFFLTKGSPLLSKFNWVILRILEAGLRKKWLEELMFEYILRKYIYGTTLDSKKHAVVLTFDQSHKIFLMLLLCHSASLIIFALELPFSSLSSTYQRLKHRLSKLCAEEVM